MRGRTTAGSASFVVYRWHRANIYVSKSALGRDGWRVVKEESGRRLGLAVAVEHCIRRSCINVEEPFGEAAHAESHQAVFSVARTPAWHSVSCCYQASRRMLPVVDKPLIQYRGRFERGILLSNGRVGGEDRLAMVAHCGMDQSGASDRVRSNGH